LDCNLYLYSHDDKIIISDVDGTVTTGEIKGVLSDLIFRKVPCHEGVCEFYRRLIKNGYKILYLTARSYRFYRWTKDFLGNRIKDYPDGLPDGPLLCSPYKFETSVMLMSLEKMKLKILEVVKAVFLNNEPFVAGFGDKSSDIACYLGIGLKRSRIYMVSTGDKCVYRYDGNFLLVKD
jgi:phosphatidate phosphatase LPIN